MSFFQFSCCYWVVLYFIFVVVRQFIIVCWFYVWVFFAVDVTPVVSFLPNAYNPVLICIIAFLIGFCFLLFICFLIILSYHNHLHKCGRQGSKDEFWAFVFVWFYFAFMFWFWFVSYIFPIFVSYMNVEMSFHELPF
jgi:hypothetical protein